MGSARETLAWLKHQTNFASLAMVQYRRTASCDGDRPEWIDAAPPHTVFHVSLNDNAPRSRKIALDCLFGIVCTDADGKYLMRFPKILTIARGYIPAKNDSGKILPKEDWPTWSCFVRIDRPRVRRMNWAA
jgi:hypothetical protein